MRLQERQGDGEVKTVAVFALVGRTEIDRGP